MLGLAQQSAGQVDARQVVAVALALRDLACELGAPRPDRHVGTAVREHFRERGAPRSCAQNCNLRHAVLLLGLRPSELSLAVIGRIPALGRCALAARAFEQRCDRLHHARGSHRPASLRREACPRMRERSTRFADRDLDVLAREEAQPLAVGGQDLLHAPVRARVIGMPCSSASRTAPDLPRIGHRPGRG